MLMFVWVLLKDSSSAHWDYTLNTMLYCGVQIEHQHFFILPWRHSDGTAIYCLSVNDKEPSSVQCCCISLCTQQSQSVGISPLIGMLRFSFYTVVFSMSTVNYMQNYWYCMYLYTYT